VERWQGGAGGRIRTWLAPHAPYTCDDDFLRATVAHARRLDVGIHIHAAEDPAQTASSLAKRGITPIQVLAQTGILDGPTLIAHGCGILPADVELLAGYRGHVGVAHCPKTYLKLASGLTPILPLQGAGVAIGLGSDGAASNNTLDIWESLRLMALTQKFSANDPEVMPVHAALDIAFAGSAAAIGMAGQLGQLAPGFLADIVRCGFGRRAQPAAAQRPGRARLQHAAADVRTVIVDGKVIMQERQLRTLDKAAIIAQVARSMERLAQRCRGGAFRCTIHRQRLRRREQPPTNRGNADLRQRLRSHDHAASASFLHLSGAFALRRGLLSSASDRSIRIETV
jgi:5-methylthioadenosine/S-adenosylhomocysteine deaminase